MTQGPQTFDEAQGEFIRFLEQNQYLGTVSWVGPDDILLSGNRIFFVRTPVPQRNVDSARQLFENAIATGSPILFHTICADSAITYAAAWVPTNHDESCRALMPRTGLKLSAHTESSKIQAVPVRSTLRWLVLRLRLHSRQNGKPDIFMAT